MQSTSTWLRLDRSLASVRSSPPRRARRGVQCAASYRASRRVHSSNSHSRNFMTHYAQSPVETPRQLRVETVGEVMTCGRIYTVSPDTPVNDALELLVEKCVTGLPVVDGDNRVVGIVSDFDVLPLDLPDDTSTGIFPALDQSWEVFHDLQNVISKAEGRTVEDVMTEDPIVVRPETSIHAAARLLLETKTRRLPVVDGNGSLIGMLTRRDVVTAALASRKEQPTLHQ